MASDDLPKDYPDKDVELVSSLGEQYGEHGLVVPATAVDASSPLGRRDGNVFQRLLYWEGLLDKKLGVESNAIERIPPEKRTGNRRQLMLMSVFWASCTMNLSCFSTGLIGPTMNLSLGRSIGITCAATIVGSLPPAWCATFGPESGLRQVSISRFSGLWFSRIVAFLNVIVNGGWCVVACISGAQALAAAVGHSLSVAAGTIVLACISFFFSVFGVNGVINYSSYAWIVMFAVFLAMYIQNAGKAFLGPSTAAGVELAGDSLTLFAIVFGSSISWSSIASDYFAVYPRDTSKPLVFCFNLFGISVPTAFGMVLGCCYSNAMSRIPAWQDAYDSKLQVGGLILAALHPRPWAKFALVMGMLSSLGVLIISTYSVSLSILQFARPLQYIPRILWTVATLVVVSVLAIAGRSALQQVLQSFLGIMGYWSCIFIGVVMTEHFVFRRSYSGYDWSAWNDPKRLPVGLGALFAFACGIAGAVVGMSETWYVGPIAAKFGGGGGDLGWLLSFVFTCIGYLPARALERRYIGR